MRPCLCCVQVAGYVIITFSSVNAHVGKLAVRPECRRQGVASALMRVSKTDSCKPLPSPVMWLVPARDTTGSGDLCS